MCLYSYYLCKSPQCDELGFPVVIQCADSLAGRDCEITKEVIAGSDHALFPDASDRMTQVLEQMGLQSPTSEQFEQRPPPPPPPSPAPSPATVDQVVQDFQQLNLTVPVSEESLEGALRWTQLEDSKTDQKGGPR